MKTFNENDPWLEDLLKTEGIEKAPQGFQANLMDRIATEEQYTVTASGGLLKYFWIVIMGGLGFLLLLGFITSTELPVKEIGAEWETAVNYIASTVETLAGVSTKFLWAFTLTLPIFLILAIEQLFSRGKSKA